MVSMADLKKFVTVYQAAGTLDEVAEKMGWEKQKVSSQAQLLRRKNIPLKKFSRNQLSEADLKELAALCNGK